MASSNPAEDDLVASKTEGYKVGEKKTVEEYAKLGRPIELSLLSTCKCLLGLQSFAYARHYSRFRIMVCALRAPLHLQNADCKG